MRRWSRQFIVSVALIMGISGVAQAGLGDSAANSTNYRVVEGEIGGDGQFDSGSTNYSIDPNVDDGGSSLGEAAVGNSSSGNYQINSGFNTTGQPGLTFCVGTSGTGCADMTGASIDLGTLSTLVATTATAKFSVKNYTAYGYAVTVVGTTPTSSGHALTPLATQTASATGSEQFGINLRANTSPSSVGADPSPMPSSAFSLYDPNVVVDSNYRSANQYRYNSGDRVAMAPASSGETTYTMSFLANIATTTPAGHYTGGLEFIATGTY